MALFRNFDPGRIVVIWNGIQVQGYGPDTFVKASRNEDSFKEQVGANGDVVHIRNRNRAGKVVMTLQDASPTNDLFSTMAANDEVTGLSYGPLMIKDLNGTTLVKSANARLARPTDVEYAADAGVNEWTLLCAELEIFAGGQVV